MIRRAQVEALLKLAEALEECERNEINFCPGDRVVELFYGQRGAWPELDSLLSVNLRLQIAKLYPKSEEA